MKSFVIIFFVSFNFTTNLVKANDQKGVGKTTQCHIHISFGSYGSGTPRKIIQDIDSYLKKNEEMVKHQETKNWGLEGEFGYCLVMTKKRFKEAMFQDLKKFIPLESKKGYTILKSDDGKVHRTTWPK